MIYCKEADKYFDSLEEVFEHYSNKPVDKIPKTVYECKLVEVDQENINLLTQLVVEYIDDCIPELNNPEGYFSDFVTEEESEELAELLSTWIKQVNTCVEPDYSRKILLREIVKIKRSFSL